LKPRGEHTQIYSLENHKLCLVGTAEIPLGGLYANKLLSKSELPIKLVGFSHCFRAEAGGLGQYNKGLYRLHQFAKVELFVICPESMSNAYHDELLSIQESIVSDLGLPYR
jgi:seryl-tRNA synthetase